MQMCALVPLKMLKLVYHHDHLGCNTLLFYLGLAL